MFSYVCHISRKHAYPPLVFTSEWLPGFFVMDALHLSNCCRSHYVRTRVMRFMLMHSAYSGAPLIFLLCLVCDLFLDECSRGTTHGVDP